MQELFEVSSRKQFSALQVMLRVAQCAISGVMVLKAARIASQLQYYDEYARLNPIPNEIVEHVKIW